MEEIGRMWDGAKGDLSKHAKQKVRTGVLSGGECVGAVLMLCVLCECTYIACVSVLCVYCVHCMCVCAVCGVIVLGVGSPFISILLVLFTALLFEEKSHSGDEG